MLFLVNLLTIMSSQAKATQLANRLTQFGQQSRPEMPQIHVDPPHMTTLRDDRKGETIQQLYRAANIQSAAEAALHPGVQNVAHIIR